jgi:hypothetical protein
VLGDTARADSSANTLYGLNMLTDPNRTLRQAAVSDGAAEAEATRAAALKALKKPKNKKQRRANAARRKQINSLYDEQVAKARQDAEGMTPLEDLQNTFAASFGDRDKLIGDMQGALGSTAEYSRLQGNLADGGELGRRLMGEALSRSERGFGQLSAEAERDAIQTARQGMAARGMATGNAGLAAEMLNRDRYSRQRAAEDINFVGGVMADERGRFMTSAGLADAERGRQLGTQQDIYNFRLSTDPRMMLAGLGQPYANLQVPGLQQLGGIVGGVQPQYSGGSPGTRGENMQLMGTLGGGALAAGGMVAGAAII